MVLHPQHTYVHLAPDGTAQELPGDTFWQLPESTMAGLGHGWLITEFAFTEDWPTWEMHPDGDEFVYLLEPETMLPIKMTETRRIRGSQQTTDYELGDYEKVAGVYFPMSIDSWQDGQQNQRQRISIAKATANVPVTSTLFAQPVSPSTSK